MRYSAEDYKKLHRKKNKYGAKKIELDGYTFDSQREGERYLELKLLRSAGEIIKLTVHPKFPIIINDKKICTYIADFSYSIPVLCGTIVEDVKSKPTLTAAARLKHKLFKACFRGYELRILF